MSMIGCVECIYYRCATKETRCNQRYRCNPLWDGAEDVGRVVKVGFCGNCKEELELCQCGQGERIPTAQWIQVR